MKTTLSYVIPIAGFILAMPIVQGQPSEEATPRKEIKQELRVIAEDGAEPKIERRMKFIGHKAGPQEMETVTYLGVYAAPVDRTLSEQLGLQRDTGLVVNIVSPESPASAVLKPHDILLKFNDQILIDQRQLSVLVRNQKEGDEVTLTVMRAGKQITAKVKLGKHEVPKMAVFNRRLPGAGGGNMSWVTSDAGMAPAAEVDHVLGLMHLGAEGAPRAVRHNQMEGDRMLSVTVNTGDSNMDFSDEKGSLELTIKDGKKELVAKDPKGKTIFSGPINTPEERKGLPPEVAERLKKIEHMQGFSFKTGEGFEGGEVKVIRHKGQGISLPLPAEAPAARPQQVL
jgi:hypothetical protein